MRLLKDIPSSKIVAIDIETVRIKEKYEDLSEEMKDAFAYKNKQDGEIPNEEELANIWTKTASLYPEFSKVCAVSLAFLGNSGEQLFCNEIVSYDEKEILATLAGTLKKIHSNSPAYRLVGHAAKFFDYPFLCKRFVINGMEIPFILDTAHLKPWEQMNLCTNEIWKMGGTGYGSSLQAICTVLGIPISKNDLVGDEVGKAYYNNELERIGRYCSQDTIATFDIIRVLKGEPIFQFVEVNIINKSVSESVEQNPVLNRLYSTKELTEEIKEEIKQIFLDKNAAVEEYEMLRRMLKDLYINNEMFKADSKVVALSKSIEVDEFIDSLIK